MKQFLYIILFFGCGILALYEQTKPQPNKIIMLISLGVFIVGLYQLMKKIPSKNSDENEE